MRLFFSYKGIFFFYIGKEEKLPVVCTRSSSSKFDSGFFLFSTFDGRVSFVPVLFSKGNQSIPNMNAKNKKRGSHQVIQLWHEPIRVDWIPWSVLIAGRQFTGRRFFFFIFLFQWISFIYRNSAPNQKLPIQDSCCCWRQLSA